MTEKNTNNEYRKDKVKNFFNNESNSFFIGNEDSILRCFVLSELLKDLEAKTILDVGCGNGELSLQFIEKNKVDFLDVAPKMLSAVRQRIPASQMDNATFREGDFLEIRFSKRYDIILMVGVLPHMSDLKSPLEKGWQLLNENGILILQFTDAEKLLDHLLVFIRRLFCKSSYSLNVTGRKQIIEFVVNAGFEILESRNLPTVFPSFSVLPRFLLRAFLRSIYKSSFFSFFKTETVFVLKKLNNNTKN